MIFCRCTKVAAKELKCSQAWQNCQGNCLNGVPQVDSEDEVDQEDPVSVSLQGSDEEDDSETKDENEDKDQSPSSLKKARN